MKYSISDISNIIQAQTWLRIEAVHIENVLTDSRRLVFPSTTLFFAINGPRRNGTDFIKELYANGVSNFVVNDDINQQFVTDYPKVNFLVVKDSLHALQQLAIYHRHQFDSTVIGITGSNGKTIVKEWLYQLLHHNYNIVRSPKSYNSQIGVPLSVLQISEQNNLAIFEAGISLPNEMDKLEPIINPTIGVLTYIGDAHAEGFESHSHKIKEKLKLFTRSNILIYCSENTLVNELVEQFIQKENSSTRLFTWSRTSQADLSVIDIIKKYGQSQISLLYQNKSFSIKIPFTDEASIYNVITCCAVLIELGIEIQMIPAKMQELEPVAMRLELKQAINHCAVINDSYNADLDSLNIALDFLSQQQAYAGKTLILSDFLQSGLSDDDLYQKIASIIQQKGINRLFGIGSKISMYQKHFSAVKDISFYPTTIEFLSALPQLTFNNEAILLKGARIFEFEKISHVLEQKLHDTMLEINLNAIRQNLKIYRERLSPTTKIMAMVKAFSYGSGSVEIASLLQQEGIDYLAVAYTDEAVELRKGGIRLPIMVMNANEIDFYNIVRFQLEPEIYSFRILDAFMQYLLAEQVTQFPIHLKLDTGMHRLGFMQSDMPSLCEQLQSTNLFNIKSVFSHLAASENSAFDDFTYQQAKLFDAMSSQIQLISKNNFIRHIANTAAIHRHPNLQFDMVRLGIGMYGVDSNLKLHNVTTLKTTIAQIKNVKKEDTVGYGRRGVLCQDAQIATVRIGYADGYPRAFGMGNGKMLVNGKLAAVIGSVCMDMTMLDITGINAKEGDDVIVFGEALPVEQIAVWANTIPYEILTNISQRVKRVYFEE